MNKISTFELADARAKELIPIRDDIEATVTQEPKVYDSKRFWLVTFVNKETRESITLRGAISYIADNGKLITFSSNPLITPFEEHERLLLQKYPE